ncbi:MAG: hypothetical protein WAM28_00700 [Chlamydiales bacterium]
MNHPKQNKVRLSVDCTEEERMYIKMLATRKQMTISEYLLSFARAEMPKKKAKRSRIPNKTTEKALKESEKGISESYESIDEFWKSMGINP